MDHHIAPRELHTYLAVAERTARIAGELLSKRQGLVTVEHKAGPADLVTAADREAETIITDILHTAFPDDAIIGEESGSTAGVGPNRWIVDPLDGTTNFAQGLALFSVSIALERHGRLLVGVVHMPALNVMYSAVRGGGAWRNGTRLRVSDSARLADAMLATGIGPDPEKGGRATVRQIEAFIERSRGVRMLGSTAIHLAYVADGTVDAYWAPDPHAWDVAAGALLVEEAGGRVTDMGGGPLNLDRPRIVATNGRIHEEVLQVLRENADGTAG